MTRDTGIGGEFKFQFTHPGGVRLIGVGEDGRKTSVSIHAPGRGATAISGNYIMDKTSFNSRTREGCDTQKDRAHHSSIPVSIHAPGRGATEKASSRSSMMEFQFTHPGGVRP